MDIDKALGLAAQKSKTRARSGKGFAAMIDESLDRIMAQREAGTALSDIAETLEVPVARLSEAVTRAQRKRSGLTVTGTERKYPKGKPRPIGDKDALSHFGRHVPCAQSSAPTVTSTLLTPQNNITPQLVDVRPVAPNLSKVDAAIKPKGYVQMAYERPRPTAGHETIVYASQPRQTEAPWGAALGVLAGAAIGMCAGDFSYDLLAKVEPSLCAYQSIPINLTYAKFLMTSVIHMADEHIFPAIGWEWFPITGAAIAAAAGGVIGVVTCWKPGQRHIEGPRYVPSYKIPRINKNAAPGVWLSNRVQLSRRQETLGFVTIGKAGSGKTTALIPIVDQAINADYGDRVFIIDFKGDYFQRYGKEAGVSYIAPWSPDSCTWLLGEDIKDAADSEAFAESLIPEGQGDPIWGAAARGVVSGIVQQLQVDLAGVWGWGDLAARLKELLSNTALLKAAIAQHKPLVADRIESMAEETRESVFFNIVTYGESIISIARIESKLKNGKTWSVARWLKGGDKTIIIGWSPERESLSQRIALPIFKLAMQRLLSMPNVKPTDPGYWFFIDEAGQLGEVPGFVSAYTACRSRGGRLFCGFQSFSQIETFYGEESRVIIGSETRLLGQLTDPSDAEDASKICGSAVIERLTITTQVNGGRSESWPRNEEPVYRAAKFSTLGVVKGGVRMVYVGRGVVSEILFPHLEG